ncbi:MAG TPA: VOC family protein [Solimonas sp.]|nr:VOC family protein [Solimonas sp.]
MKTISPVPDAAHRLTPHLVMRDAARAIAFYVEVFGAREEFRLTEPSGKVGHAELRLGGGCLMLADEYPDFGALGPAAVGGTPVSLHLYVEDVDAVVARAEAAGATLLRPVTDEFYGDRTAMLLDPYGHRWQLASRREELSPAEMQRRWSAMLQGAQ